ncbi:hypothetical protein K2173_011040 [Erythroxylum novogranatense]|uniref:HMA domain-containing protein n=1 Tax=Erythroxylum novogranatense TaxID=1862640 RepID=A0AAV8T247_9ROSI|nr:hypothetical protein K2173_011040 [Erythroxylum novogranatense]
MADVRVTTMVVKVDLKCEKCKKKIKKVLCKIPQIENQVYDEKNNAVIITVVCCSPEKIKQKIYCKGGDIILGIEILKPPKKPKPTPKLPEPAIVKPPEQPKPTPKPPTPQPQPAPPTPPSKPPQPKPQPAPPALPPPEPVPACPPRDCCRECYEGYGWGPCYRGHGRPPPSKPQPFPPALPLPKPVPACPPRDCCRECYEGYGWGPCYQGHPPPPCYDSYYGGYGRPVYDSWGSGSRRVYVSKCSDYICEENPTACTIM